MTKVRIFDGQAKIKPLDQSNNEKKSHETSFILKTQIN